MNWHKRFDIIRQKIKESLARQNERDTDEHAAAFVGTSIATYRRWKSGSQLPGTEALLVFSEKLGISIDWFLTGEGFPFKASESAEHTGPESTPNSPHPEGPPLDQLIFEKVLATLEQELIRAKKHLPPKHKARAIRLMYQIAMTGASDAEMAAIAGGLIRENVVNQ